MIRLHWLFVNVLAVVGFGASNLNADLLDTNGSYDLIGTNFPIDFSASLTPDGTVKSLAGGRLEVFEIVTADGPDSEWIEFVFSTPDGSRLADDIDSRWEIEIENLPMTEMVVSDFVFAYWTIDGAAVDPIFPNGGHPFSVVNPNPIDPLIGAVFGGPLDPPFGPATSLSPSLFSLPYRLIENNGVDPLQANGFRFGFRVASVPEPSSSFLICIVGLVGLVRCRHRRKQRVVAV